MRPIRLLLCLPLAAACASDDASLPGGPGGGGGKTDDPTASPAVLAAAAKNLERISAEIDPFHLANYGLGGTTAEQFLAAVTLEYADVPEQLDVRLRALASMVFFAAPDILPPEGGKTTPFHGLDMEQFDSLMELEDRVWGELVDQNDGSVSGVRPFSVCETTFLIESYVRPGKPMPAFPTYKTDYAAFAATCPEADLAEWYNFRGLGHLRPSWLESNIQDRFLRRMLKKCEGPDAGWADECAEFEADRLGYRLDRNRQLASRFLVYHPDDQGLMADTKDEVLLLEDRDGDGVGEFVTDGPARLADGSAVTLEIRKSGEFSGSLKGKKATGPELSIKPRDVVAQDRVHPDFEPGQLEQPDFGLLDLFADPAGCTGESPRPEQCPLLERFFTLIDRHEDFYQTFTGMRPESSGLSSQPSPLVACSITLAASHEWDSAGIPDGGEAGFIFLMRIPFKQILAGSRASVATLQPGPEVLAVQDLYDGGELDMSRVWLDIATLSNNLFESEHEISKFGAVPAEQIEGILVIRRPAAMED